MEVERSIDHIILQQNELLALVQNAFPNCSHLQKWEILKGGAQNTNYKFKIADEEFVLRIYARDRSHCKIEKELHNLIDRTVPTAKLIYADENNEPWAYSIFQFISGPHISSLKKDLQSTLSYELGKTLALIHSFKFKEAGLFGNGLKINIPFEIGSSPYFEETFRVLSNNNGPARIRLGPKLSEQMLQFILQNQDYFPKVNDNVCLTHSDFKPVNLLYGKDGKVFVLDWEFAHPGIGILDFAILLRHRDQFPLEIEALKQGYFQNGGALPTEWLKSAMITDFVNIATMMDTQAERQEITEKILEGSGSRQEIKALISEYKNDLNYSDHFINYFRPDAICKSILKMKA